MSTCALAILDYGVYSIGRGAHAVSGAGAGGICFQRCLARPASAEGRSCQLALQFLRMAADQEHIGRQGGAAQLSKSFCSNLRLLVGLRGDAVQAVQLLLASASGGGGRLRVRSHLCAGGGLGHRSQLRGRGGGRAGGQRRRSLQRCLELRERVADGHRRRHSGAAGQSAGGHSGPL